MIIVAHKFQNPLSELIKKSPEVQDHEETVNIKYSLIISNTVN